MEDKTLIDFLTLGNNNEAYRAGIEKGRQQVIEWGNEQCQHQVTRLGGGKWINPNFRIVKKNCPDCWAELEKESG